MSDDEHQTQHDHDDDDAVPHQSNLDLLMDEFSSSPLRLDLPDSPEPLAPLRDEAIPVEHRPLDDFDGKQCFFVVDVVFCNIKYNNIFVDNLSSPIRFTQTSPPSSPSDNRRRQRDDENDMTAAARARTR
jgi:hypothetical protein